MTYIRKTVAQPQRANPGAPAPKDPNVIIIAHSDIVTWPLRDGNGILMNGSFTFKDNAKMYQFYTTPSKTKASFEPDGEEDAITLGQKFECESPGDSLELAEFVQNWTGVNCVIIYGSCVDDYRTVMGTKCAPLQLKPSKQDDNDARKYMLTFEQFAKTGYMPGRYTGPVVFDAPFDVVVATAITVNEANGRTYNLPATAVTASVAFAAIALAHGEQITLIGGGGVAAATLATGVADKSALLVNGTTWVALKGAVITLKVFKNGAITLMQEVSRG